MLCVCMLISFVCVGLFAGRVLEQFFSCMQWKVQHCHLQLSYITMESTTLSLTIVLHNNGRYNTVTYSCLT